jgi:hypothetical protein
VFNMDTAELADEDLRKRLVRAGRSGRGDLPGRQDRGRPAELPETRPRNCWPRPAWASRAWPSWPGPGSAPSACRRSSPRGPKETRAWEIPAGATAPEAAGVIHTDFQRGFIKAEVVSFDDLMAAGSLPAARAAGKARIEGKDYVMRDGDVVEFRFNV